MATKSALVMVLAHGASALQLPVAQQIVSVRAAAAVAPATAADSLVFPGVLIADGEAMSPAKAKIQAAKEAAAAKAAAGGFKAPETKVTTVDVNFKAGADAENPFAEADELRAKIVAIKESGKVSKSKSAQLASLSQMEEQARDKARRQIAAKEEKAERAAAREAERAAVAAGGSGSYSDSLAKVTGIKAPALPSVSVQLPF